MPSRPQMSTPWYVNPGRHAWFVLEYPASLPDYEPAFLLEDDGGNLDHKLLLENA